MDMGLLFFSSCFLLSDVSIPVGLRVLIQYGKWKGKEREGKENRKKEKRMSWNGFVFDS